MRRHVPKPKIQLESARQILIKWELYLLALWTTERRHSGKQQQESNNCLYVQNDGGDNDSSPLSALHFFIRAVHQHSKVSFGIFRRHEINFGLFRSQILFKTDPKQEIP
jgi:hypothetical protein